MIASFAINLYSATIWYFYPSFTLIFLLATYNLSLFFSHRRSYWLIAALSTTFAGMIIFNSWKHQRYIAQAEKIAGKTHDFFATVIDSIPEHNGQKITLKMEKFYDHQSNTYRPCAQTICIHSSEKYIDLELSQILHIKNLYIKNSTHKTFNHYLEKERVHALVRTKKINYSITGMHYSFTSYLKKHLHRIENTLQEKTSRITLWLLKKLFLGWPQKEPFDRSYTKIYSLFNNWGIDHFLARSGLHVSILIFLLGFCCLTPVSSIRVKALISALFLILYAQLSYTSSSFKRAAITAILTQSCLYFILPINPLYLFLLAHVILIIYNPIAIFFLDFQLTTLITGMLCLVAHIKRNSLKN